MNGAGALPMEHNQVPLTSAAAEGDSAAFDLVIHRHSAQVFRLALRMLGNREDAEDVQQETFLRAYRGLRKFRGEAAISTWLYSIAARLCLSRKRRPRLSEEPLPEADLGLGHLRDDPEAEVLSRESAARVQRTLLALAPADRLLIVLKYIEGASHEEIARVLGCSAQSSRSRLARAKRLFRERYQRME